MQAGGTTNDRASLGSSVTIKGDTLLVEDFVYRGFLLTSDNNVIREIRKHIICGSRSYQSAPQEPAVENDSPSHVQNADKTGGSLRHKTWTMLEENVKELEACLGIVPYLENGVWRQRMNHELVAFYTR